MERGTILLVDDNPQILTIMAELLRPLGYTIHCAQSGQSALELAAAAPPDLMVLDVMMPGMDGFTVCRRVRADPLLAQVPIILVTALDDRESRVRGFEAGADEFVSKPFDYVELRARVATILRLNRYRHLLDEQARVGAERARFEWAVEQSDDGVLVLGPDDRPRYANPRARHLLGIPEGAPASEPFLSLARRSFSLVPPEAWEHWPQPHGDNQCFLVRPESRTANEAWFRVDLLPASAGDDARVLRLRDVTEQITSQREMWSFHAMLSHKLRTPLVGILGGLSIIAGSATTMDPAHIAHIADVALASARRLSGEIEDILHYMRPPADLFGAESPTVATAATLCQQLAADLGAPSVSVAIPPELADRRLTLSVRGLEVALREVVENAVKFHPQHFPALQFSAAPLDDDHVELRIADDGPGLRQEQLAHVWRPYYQGERSFTGQIDGMGLGLALVARIIHAIGGRYAIANRSDGPGAIVTLTLPTDRD
ncbi:MAG: response regulator [Chloroflexi bacterium OHK40]